MLDWVEGVINDETVFPTSTDSRYPRDFEKVSRGIFKRLFRVFAILYTHHYSRMESMGAVAHLNTSFKHFMFFCFEFDLVPSCELEAIDMLVDRMRQEYVAQGGSIKHGGECAPTGSGSSSPVPIRTK